MIKGIDFSFGSGVTTAQIKSAGYQFVCRYLSGGNSKDISAAEVTNYKNAGIPVVFVWEVGGNEYTQAGGAADARAAEAELAKVGAPGATVFFAQDVPVAAGTNPVAYMRGVNSVIGLDRSGIYGDYAVVKSVLDAGVAKYAWQTSGGSGGAWDNRAMIRQTGYNLHVGPASVDENEAAFYNNSTVLTLAHDFGQYPRPGSPTPTPTPAPGVPTNGKTTSITATSAVITYTGVPGGVKYDIQVVDSSGAQVFRTSVGGSSGSGVKITGLKPSTAYKWRIAAYNSANVAGGWSGFIPFTTISDAGTWTYPAPGGVGIGQGTATVPVHWNAVSHNGAVAPSYTVEILDAAGKQFQTHGNVVGTTLNVTLPRGKYTARVWANGAPVGSKHTDYTFTL